MTTATRKTKTADTAPLLQKGDRIRGTSPEGHQHAGTFEGYSSKDMALCKEGARTIALLPTSVERVAEPAPKLPTKITEVNSVAVYQSEVYYSEPKQGAWHLASDAEIAALEKGDRVSMSDIPWVYKFVKLGGDGTGDMVAVCAFVDHPCFHYHIPVTRLQVAGVRSQESVNTLSELPNESEAADFVNQATIAINQAAFDQFAETYSADLLTNDKIRGTFHWREREFVCTGKNLNSQHHPDSLRAVEVVALEDWDRELYNYRGLCDKEVFSYEGQLVKHRRRELVLSDREVHFAIAPSPDPNPAAQLSVLAVEILALYADAEQAEATMLNAGKAALSLYIALGEKLLTVKNQIGHGEWLPWLKARKIQERKAQRAIAVFKGFPQLAAINDSVTDLTLTEALSQLSKKALKPAPPDQESGVSGQESALTPAAIEEQFTPIADLATPTLEQLMTLYTQIGTVKPWRKGFAVERDSFGNPFPLAFRDRASAWRRWQQQWRAFAVSHPLPATEAPVQASDTASEKTEGLEDEKRASDSHHYSPIEPKPVWFQVGQEWVEGQAIAANGHGFFRIQYGEGRESDIPGGRVWWSKPDLERAAAIDADLDALGWERDQPSETEVLERESGRNNSEVARLQFEGATELVKAAITQSKLSLVEVVQVVLELANKKEFETICDLLIKEGS